MPPHKLAKPFQPACAGCAQHLEGPHHTDNEGRWWHHQCRHKHTTIRPAEQCTLPATTPDAHTKAV